MVGVFEDQSRDFLPEIVRERNLTNDVPNNVTDPHLINGLVAEITLLLFVVVSTEQV